MSLIEVTVSFLIMAAGMAASAAAWYTGTSGIQRVQDIQSATLCADNAAEVITAGQTFSGGGTAKEGSGNENACTIQVIHESDGEGQWEEIIAKSGNATERLCLREGL